GLAHTSSTGSGDPEIPEIPRARDYILASELRQSSTFGAPVSDHRSCPFSPSMSDSSLDIRVLDQVAVYQLTAADVTKQLLLASLMGISEV
ncbi:hypothetical protein AVEN_134080-1, partial [Araneus ventricosus]